MGVFDVHIRGALEITKQFAPSMIEKSKGSILWISSMATVMGLPLVTSYSMAKSAMHGAVYIIIEFDYGVRATLFPDKLNLPWR